MIFSDISENIRTGLFKCGFPVGVFLGGAKVFAKNVWGTKILSEILRGVKRFHNFPNFTLISLVFLFREQGENIPHFSPH